MGRDPSAALSHVRICDFTGQLAGAGATKFLAAFGAQVIRIEDPVRQGRWDILRGAPPFRDERRGIDLGGAFNNHTRLEASLAELRGRRTANAQPRRVPAASRHRAAPGAPRARALECGQATVALLLYHCPEYIETMLGCFRARAVPFNVNQRQQSLQRHQDRKVRCWSPVCFESGDLVVNVLG